MNIKTQVPLCRYTTFNIGGPADLFSRADSITALQEAVQYCRERNIPFFLLGGGSNLLIDDRGIRGMAIKNQLKGIRRKGNSLVIKSGEKLSGVVEFAQKESLSGLEFASGIPGTIGGAVYGNAGAYGKNIGEILKKARIIRRDTGKMEETGPEYFDFQYRWSRLKITGDVLVEVTLELKPGDGEAVRMEIDRILAERVGKHPDKSWGCAGSYFKNLPPDKPGLRRTAAGKLLDEAGARGMTCGCAKVFPGHANFLTNPGGATCEQVLELAEILKKKVKEKFGVELEEEVLYVDENLTRFEYCQCRDRL